MQNYTAPTAELLANVGGNLLEGSQNPGFDLPEDEF